MRRLARLLLHNWWLKGLSLALSYGLWVVVTQSPPVEIGVSVPLELRHLPADLQVVGEIPTRVHLHLYGPEARLRTIQPEDVGVVVDLSRATAGNHAIELQIEHAEVPPGIQVVRIVPSQVRLQLVAR